jgi:hypothetical protein
VLIGAGFGVEAGVGARRHRVQQAGGYVLGQGPVQAVHHRSLVEARGQLGVEVHHLVAGVHAGVGAAAAQSADGLAQHLGEAALYLPLHGQGIGLHLPAVVERAVVGQMKEVAQRNSEL